MQNLSAGPCLIDVLLDAVDVRSVLHATDHERALTGVFDRSADVIELSVVDDDEAVVEPCRSSYFKVDVIDLFLECRDLDDKVWLEIPFRCEKLYGQLSWGQRFQCQQQAVADIRIHHDYFRRCLREYVTNANIGIVFGIGRKKLFADQRVFGFENSILGNDPTNIGETIVQR